MSAPRLLLTASALAFAACSNPRGPDATPRATSAAVGTAGDATRTPPGVDDAANPAPAPTEGDAADYAALGFPPTDRAWTIADYARTREAYKSLAGRPLPRLDGPGASIVERWGDTTTLRNLARSAATVQDSLRLYAALRDPLDGYAQRVRAGEDLGRESTALAASAIAVFVAIMDRPETRASTQSDVLRADPAKLSSALKSRYGLVSLVADALRVSAEHPETHAVVPLIAALGDDLTAVAAYMTGTERQHVRIALVGFADRGGEGAEPLRRAAELVVAEPADRFVREFAAEIGAFSARQAGENGQANAGVEPAMQIGPITGGWARYTASAGDFSVAFPSPPGVKRQAVNPSEEGPSGRPMQVVQMGLKTDGQYVLTAFCASPAQPGVLELARGTEGAEVTDIEVAGAPAVQLTVDGDGRFVLARTVAAATHSCTIAAEVESTSDAVAARMLARRFVESFRLDVAGEPPTDAPAVGKTPSAASVSGCNDDRDCAATERCEGPGCGENEGVCMSRARMCTRDAVAYCGCDDKTFRSSGTCALRRYSHKGECRG